jgi:hypothetical protein
MSAICPAHRQQFEALAGILQALRNHLDGEKSAARAGGGR